MMTEQEMKDIDNHHDAVMNHRAWLAKVSVGDEVLLSGQRIFRCAKVIKVTKIMITLSNGKKYDINGGVNGVGAKQTHISELTDDRRAKADFFQLVDRARIVLGRCEIPKTQDPQVLKKFIKALEPYTYS